MKIKASAWLDEYDMFSEEEERRVCPCVIIGVTRYDCICLFGDTTILPVPYSDVRVTDKEYLDLFKEN